jgi:hypothetical protein
VNANSGIFSRFYTKIFSFFNYLEVVDLTVYCREQKKRRKDILLISHSICYMFCRGFFFNSHTLIFIALQFSFLKEIVGLAHFRNNSFTSLVSVASVIGGATLPCDDGFWR